VTSTVPAGHHLNRLCEACAEQDWTVGVTTELYATAKADASVKTGGEIRSRLNSIEVYVAQRPKGTRNAQGSHREDGLITRLLLVEDDLELTAALLLERLVEKGILPEQQV